MERSPHKRKRQPTTEEQMRFAIKKEWEAQPQDWIAECHTWWTTPGQRYINREVPDRG
jgi:hypothetical protein